MNLAMLQRWGPLLAVGTKPLASITDTELGGVVEALSGGPNPDLLTVLQQARVADPTTLGVQVLGSPFVRRELAKITGADGSKPEDVFVECPRCQALFATSMRS